MSEKVFNFSDGANGAIPVGALPYLNGNNGSFLGGNGLGAGLVGFLIGALINNNGNGLFGGGNNNQNNYADLIMQAVNNSGERSVAAVNQLSNMLGQDFNQVYGAVQTLNTGINQIAANQGVNALQVINALQSGNAAMQSQLCSCCCNIQNTLAQNAAADQLAICQQTNALTNQANNNTQAVLAKIDAVEDSRKDREIASLTAKVAQLESQNFTTGVVQQAVSPILGQIASLANDIAAIKRCQPSTITLPNNSMTAVPTIWANAVADNVVDKISAALNPTTTTTTPTA